LSALPPPEVYEAEYEYWPWAQAIQLTVKLVMRIARPGGTIVDYMCGTGHLLRRIRLVRPDLELIGCDQNSAYIEFAAKTAPEITFVEKSFPGDEFIVAPDVAICTAGIHHLPEADQQTFLTRLSESLRDNGTAIIGEEVIEPYLDEKSRRQSVINLWFPAIHKMAGAGAPDDVILAAMDVLRADIRRTGEFKTSFAHLHSLLSRVFVIESTTWAWKLPRKEAGDVVLVCAPRRDPSAK
jgi:SAM-dependent methyltransferase